METKKYLLSLFLVSMFIISAIFVTAISKDWVLIKEADKGNIKVYNTPNGEVITDYGKIIERYNLNQTLNGDLIASKNGTEHLRIVNKFDSENIKGYDEKDKGLYLKSKNDIDVYEKNNKFVYYESLKLRNDKNLRSELK